MAKTVLAIDSARHFGWAYGPTDGVPRSGHGFYSEKGSRVEVYAAAQRWLGRAIEKLSPTLIIIEEPVFMSGANTMKTHDFLHGLCAVLETQAQLSGHFRVHVESAARARKAFLPPAALRKGEKAPKLAKDDLKKLVRDRCLELGWIDPETYDGNLDRTDALCMWAFGASILEPNNTVRHLPLFTGAN